MRATTASTLGIIDRVGVVVEVDELVVGVAGHRGWPLGGCSGVGAEPLVDRQFGSWSCRVVPEVSDGGFAAAGEGDDCGVGVRAPTEDSNSDSGVVRMERPARCGGVVPGGLA
jgi:hypothetical protein